jgi:signal transduction histidine kinase
VRADFLRHLSGPLIPLRGTAFHLSRWFAFVGLVSVASVSAVSGWLLSGFLTERLLQQEARLTHEFVESVVNVEEARPFFAEVHRPPAPEWLELVEHISQLPDVLRANLYSQRRTIVWSSDASLIGSQFNDNPELERALRGELVAHGGEGEKREHDKLPGHLAYFVEIYAPVWDRTRGEVIGVVELYKAPTALFSAISAAQRAVWLAAILAGGFLYMALFWMVRRADLLIRAQRERLVQSETLAALGEMSSAVAHGIRNPLATIRSAAELALDSKPAEWRDAARDIVAQVDRLDVWVRKLLSYSEPLDGRLEPIAVGSLLCESLGNFARELDRRRIQLSARLGGALPPVAADALMLGQVFNSLIANAVEAIERDGRIVVTAERAADGQLRVSIRDSGPGMSREQLERAFKPFQTTKTKGLGVGLALARRIIERFGGSISLASKPGSGTTVDVVLPAA